MTEQEQTDAEFIAAVKPVCEAAREELSMLCKNIKRNWKMTIPVKPDDSDVVIASALRALPEALERLAEADKALRVRHSDDANDMVSLGVDRDSWKARAEAAEAERGVLQNNKLAADQIMNDAVRALEEARAERGRQMMNALNDQERANDMERERDELREKYERTAKLGHNPEPAAKQFSDQIREQYPEAADFIIDIARRALQVEKLVTKTDDLHKIDHLKLAIERDRACVNAERERDELRAEVADLRSRLDWIDRTVNPVTDRNTMP